jgi:elongation factor G
MGELHLGYHRGQYEKRIQSRSNIGAPQVAYRETVTKEVKMEEKYAKQSGGKGQYGHVLLKSLPQEPGVGYEFVNSIVGGKIPKEYIPAIDKGIQEAMTRGILPDIQLLTSKLSFTMDHIHDVDSSEMAFKIAGSICIPKCM